MNAQLIIRGASGLMAALAMCSCLAVDEYQRPDVSTDGLFPAQKVDLDRMTLAEMPWQQVFSDPVLRDHIREALHHNLRLQRAIAKIRVAEANFYAAKRALFPSLSAHAEYGYSDPSDNNVNFGAELDDISIPATSTYTLSLQASWEVDIWGELTSLERAQLAAVLRSEAARRAVQTRLIADVASGYYTLLALDNQLAITRRTVDTRRQEVQALRNLKKGAIVTEVAVQQAVASRYTAQVKIPQLQQQIEEQKNAFNRLLGRAPRPVERSSLDKQDPIDSLAVGVPAELLRNRPDVIEAEYAFRQAFALTNNARAQFYPQLTLTAQGGLKSLEAKDLFETGSIFYNLIAGLTQPIFDQGQNSARLKRTRAQQKQAALQLQDTLLQAGVEVSNALSQFRKTDRTLAMRRKQLDALEQAVDYARKLLQYGESNYTDVLTARQNLLSARLQTVGVKLRQLNAGVSLYRALGGGWRTTKVTDKQIPGQLSDSDQ